MTPFRTAAVLLGTVFLGSVAAAETDTGSICLAKISVDAKALDRETDRDLAHYVFTVQVDDGERMEISTERFGVIRGLALGSRHLMKVRHDGKLLQSFWFTFEERNAEELCLWYKAWYATWVLSPKAGQGAWCDCTEADTQRAGEAEPTGADSHLASAHGC